MCFTHHVFGSGKAVCPAIVAYLCCLLIYIDPTLLSQNGFSLQLQAALRPIRRYQRWSNTLIWENASLHCFSPEIRVCGETSCSIDFSFTFCHLSLSVFSSSPSFLPSLPSNRLSVVRPPISPVYSVVIQDNMFQHLPLHMMPDPCHWPSLCHATHTNTHI